jgi:hypothetical protein
VLDREVVLVDVAEVEHEPALRLRALREQREPADRRAEVDADVQARHARRVQRHERDVLPVAREEAVVGEAGAI